MVKEEGGLGTIAPVQVVGSTDVAGMNKTLKFHHLTARRVWGGGEPYSPND